MACGSKVYGKRSSTALDDVPEGLAMRASDAEVKRRILLGTYALSAGYYDAYYRKAQQVRTLLTRDFLTAFGEVDVLISPVTPTPCVVKLGREDGRSSEDVSRRHLLGCGEALAGICGVSVPCGD